MSSTNKSTQSSSASNLVKMAMALNIPEAADRIAMTDDLNSKELFDLAVAYFQHRLSGPRCARVLSMKLDKEIKAAEVAALFTGFLTRLARRGKLSHS